MYRTFSIENFRLFKSLKFDDLGRVNLVSGRNCVGKTSLLEALWLYSGAYKPDLALHLDALRGMAVKRLDARPEGDAPWDSLFRDFEADQTIGLSAKHSKLPARTLMLKSLAQAPQGLPWLTTVPGAEIAKDAVDLASAQLKTSCVLELSYSEGQRSGKHYLFMGPQGPVVLPTPPPVPFNAHILTSTFRGEGRADAEYFGNVQARGEEATLVEVLQEVEPRIRQVFVRIVANLPTFYANLDKGKSMPLPLMGAGLSRLWGMALRVADAPSGIVLIDEVENGLHCSVLKQVWQRLSAAAQKYDVQLFVTTHSLECIRAAHEVFSKNGCDFRFHRLDRLDGGEIRAATYDCRTLGAGLDMNLEVR